MKLIIRGDDFGYSSAFNAGYYQCIKKGIMTSAELMIGMPGTLEAVRMLVEFPWIPVGWHVHVCGYPSADASKVPKLLDDEGKLKLHISRGHPDDESIAEQLEIEMRAELETFIKYMNKKPDTISNVDDKKDPYSRILKSLAYEYHINHVHRNLEENKCFYCKWVEKDGEWILKKYPINILPTRQNWAQLDQKNDYNPFHSVFKANEEILKQKDGTSLIVLHPGYMDNTILCDSTCNVARVKDCEVLMKRNTADFLNKLGVELITSNDYMFERNDYKNWQMTRDM